MAVRTDYSTQYTQEQQAPKIQDFVTQNFGLQVLPFDFTMGSVAGDIGSTVALRRLPSGQVYLFPTLSRMSWSAFGAARTLDIGYAAYTGFDLVAVVADDNLFDDNVDVSSAGDAYLGSDYVAATIANTGGFSLFNSQTGVTILATVAGDTIPAAAQLHGFLVICQVSP